MLSKKLSVIVTVGILFCLSCNAYAGSQVIMVSQSSDDAEESPGGGVGLTSSDLELVEDSSNQTVGMRFNGVNIPPGSLVTSAYIQFTCDETRNQNPCNLVIQGQATDNASTFTTSAYNISSRDRTGALVNWSPPDWTLARPAGPDQRTPDLSAIIQEIVNGSGWSQGNALAVIITGTGARVATSYDRSGWTPAELHLEWSMYDHLVVFAEAASSAPEDGGTVDIGVQLTAGNPGTTVTVDYTVTDITTDSGDYWPHPAAGTLTFLPGVTFQTISITIVDDTTSEPSEKIIVVLSNPRNTSLGSRAEHTFTINASDLPPDWPMWRYDAGRTAASPEELPAELHLQWVRHLPTPKPAWPKQVSKYPRLCFDSSYEPVVMGKAMFVPSMVTDSVSALDTDTGAELWKFYTDGPVRLAPVAFDGKVAFVSDDGYLYCLDARDGSLLWKYRHVPYGRKDRKVLGNDRLISLWPARGGPVLSDGKIYFASGVWPCEGVSVSAVEAETGRLVWCNDEIGWIENGQLDHGRVSDGGLSPQGYLAMIGDKLFVPSGRAMPGRFDPEDGKLEEPYSSGWGGRPGLAKGCWFVSGTDSYFFHSGDLYNLSTNERLAIDPACQKHLGDFRKPVLTDNVVYYSQVRIVASEVLLDSGLNKLWDFPSDLKVHIKAGSRLYGGKKDIVAAIGERKTRGHWVQDISWEGEIEGTPSTMLAADGKLFVVTEHGNIYCFGPESITPKVYAFPSGQTVATDNQAIQTAEDILQTTGVNEGYCLVLGLGSGQLTRDLAEHSRLHVIAVDPDITKVNRLRRELNDAGLYGTRIAVYPGDPASYPFPPYMASLIVSEDPIAVGISSNTNCIDRIFRSLRPYGGVACLTIPADQQEALTESIKVLDLHDARVYQSGPFTLLERSNALLGSADWTHEYADAGKSMVSRDKRVKPPFNVLWFGGEVDNLFPNWDFTHFRPPTPLVVGGRMFFQVFPKLHAIDVYTGRHLWTIDLPGTELNPLRQDINYAASNDSIYVVSVSDGSCHRVDVTNGSTLSIIRPPADAPVGLGWREVRLWNDRLLGVAGNDLFCMDRGNGEVLWKYEATENLIALAAGSGRVFLIDSSLGSLLHGRGNNNILNNILALDIRDGNTLWQVDVKSDIVEIVKIGYLSLLRLAYSEVNEILIMLWNPQTELAELYQDENKIDAFRLDASIHAYDAENGTLLWASDEIPGGFQTMLHHNRLITQIGFMYDLRTGSNLGELRKLTSIRGCNRPIAGEHIVAVRDGHASYFDLESYEQTYFRGVRAGCTNALIPANGLLNMPNFSRFCACNYPVFASLALVPVKDLWQAEFEEVSSVEDFETGDFSSFNWILSGDANWTITSEQKNSGDYSAQAGSIGNDEYTTLEITLDCVSGDITFYRKVSSESGWDKLKFYIDGIEQDAWSGEKDWEQVSFPVEAGTRNFKWTYTKDSSGSDGSDTTWIDDIVFPIP